MYGKLENGILNYAPNGVEIDMTWYIPPSSEQLLELGYKPIEETPMPEPQEHYQYSFTWAEDENKIYKVWEGHYVEPTYTLEERLAIQEETITALMEMIGGAE